MQDWDDCGFKEIAIQLKTNQEPSMISLQATVQSIRPKDMIPVNNPVRESESNGRVENAIRRAQEKSRVLRHQLEENMQRKLPDTSPMMAWLVRWATELLTKYSCGDDGRSAHERLHGETCITPLVPFGESVLYLPFKPMRRDKSDVATRPSIWLGIIARTQETLIGTENGTIKCRTMTRLPGNEQWSAKQMLQSRSAPWEPILSKTNKRMPIAIDGQGNGIQPEDGDGEEQGQDQGEDGEIPEMQFGGGGAGDQTNFMCLRKLSRGMVRRRDAQRATSSKGEEVILEE